MRWLIAAMILVYGTLGVIFLVHQILAPIPPAPVVLVVEPPLPDPLDAILVVVLKLVVIGVIVLLLASVPMLLVMKLAAAVYRAWRTSDLVATDPDGRWPITVTAIQDPRYGLASVASFHQTQLALAANSGAVPHTIHYEVAGLPQLPPPGVVPPEPPTPITPTFASLLMAGRFGPGHPMLMGYTDQGELEGNWKKLATTAVSGLSGAGKTTTLRFLAGQFALYGARFVILDPHMDAGEDSLADTLAPLRSRFLAPPAQDPRVMLGLLARVQATLESRLRGGPKPWPVVVAVDEFTGLMARSDLAGPLAEVIEQIAQEGRKVGVIALVSGQIFTANRAGGSALRDAIASAYVHRMKRNQARLLLPADVAREAETLPTGEAILYQQSGEIVRVRVPLTTGADMEAIGKLLAMEGPTATVVEPEEPIATGPVAPATPEEPQRLPATKPEEDPDEVKYDPGDTVEFSSQVAESPDEDPRIAKALMLFDDGLGLPDAVSQAFNIGKKSPASYTKWYNQVQAAMREQRRQGGI